MACPKMDEFLEKDNKFVGKRLKVSSLEKLARIFEVIYTLNTLPYFKPALIYVNDVVCVLTIGHLHYYCSR